MCDFVHLHCHTQYSLLDGASEIGAMMDKAVADGQKAVALTDHGNMFGAFKFITEANKRNIKPIIGCEFYLVEDRHKRSFRRINGEYDRRNHQLLLAKNKTGYHNLSKLCSLGFIDGLYGKYPRIDKELIERYHEGLIATSCCLAAEIPQALIKGDMDEAEKKLKWWLNIFGEDFYIELMRHKGLDNIDALDHKGRRVLSGRSQEDINIDLVHLAKKHNVQIIATNDSHYVDEKDWVAHDILLCVNTGKTLEETNRFKFSSSDYYFKTGQQMSDLFSDHMDAIHNTAVIADKIEGISLERDVLLPKFPLPKGFKTQQDYLKDLTYKGAKMRYGEINAIVSERLEYELAVINASGYPGYFLIVHDFTDTARKMGVSVGPGRGSAAGSAVAYCLGITSIDPIKYDLLFERFLNPERVSMPDIDIDFDDEGRQKVIDYVVDKYGKDQVAQIVTYSTMGAKSALRDVGRVMDVPLNEVNEITKAFPTNLKASLRKVLADGDVDPKLKDAMSSDDVAKAYAMRKRLDGKSNISKMMSTAKDLEGSVRNTGIHACGIIITPDELINHVPVSTDKTTQLLISQFDNDVVERAGLLKMDFLGLKTLTIIRDAVKLVKYVKGVELDIEKVDLEDEKTFELFQKGETVGIFQYESPGMQKNMKGLKPTTFEDLIAMNALYRPGPMEYIPNFIKRKNGDEEINYDLEEMKSVLESTYGITVYQEQVMLLSQKLAGFTKGEADVLRKAMGKKKKNLLDELFPKFIEGGKSNGHEESVLKKVWKDWEAFASYAFNKSHSTCYAFLAFQTAFLKAHYPEEFMASVLTHSKSDVTKLSFFLDECNRMGIKVLGPSVNESFKNFTVNKDQNIRFGMSAIKGVGEKAVEDIIAERQKDPYKDIYDFIIRNSNANANKRAFEGLIVGGGLDCFEEVDRAQYFAPSGKYETFLEHLVKFGSAYLKQKDEMEFSLFGASDDVMIAPPPFPNFEPWSETKKLQKEKEVIGIFASGHPLDIYKYELEHLTTCTLDKFEDLQTHQQSFTLAGLVANVRRGENDRGNGYVRFDLMDYRGSSSFGLYREAYSAFHHFIEDGSAIYVQGVSSKSRSSGRMWFSINQVGLLETLGESKKSKLILGIPLNEVNSKLSAALKELIEENPGNQTLKIKIYDLKRTLNLPLEYGAGGVHICTNFLEGLKKLNIQYRLK